MNEGGELTGLALQDILSGIADGLNEAQQTLRNRAPYDEYGRPNTIYQLPYLDFSLQVTSEFETLQVDGNQDRKVLRFAAAKDKSVSTNSKMEIFSTISGRFVATTPNEGLPQTILDIQPGEPTKRYTKYEVNLKVIAQNAALEKLVGSKIEFNFDEELTLSLNAIDGLPQILEGEVYTDLNGEVINMVKIPAADFDKGRVFVFNVNIGNVHKTFSVGR